MSPAKATTYCTTYGPYSFKAVPAVQVYMLYWYRTLPTANHRMHLPPPPPRASYSAGLIAHI
eukprot:COSAG01_NODE_85_length_27670_cov_34.051467_23_plen_62_part_00